MQALISLFSILIGLIPLFILGWWFRVKMFMSWGRTIVFAICYPLSLLLIAVGFMILITVFDAQVLRMPIVVGGLLDIIICGIIVAIVLQKYRAFSKKFAVFSYLFFMFPVISVVIFFAVFMVSFFLSIKGYISPDLINWAAENV